MTVTTSPHILEPGPLNAITDVPGVLVGHHTDARVFRGTTALLFPEGAIAGVEVRGSNPGTFNTDALASTTVSGLVHAIGLSGGSLFGLGAIAGITEWLLEQRIGLPRRGALIPIVSGAVIYDLDLSDPYRHPTADWGGAAAAAAKPGAFERGNVGAGRGGTAGKGPGCVRTKGGLGTASLTLPDGIMVGALIVVNALGGLVHPVTGQLYATHGGFGIPTLYRQFDETAQPSDAIANTTLAVVATNAGLTKPQLVKMAQLAHDGLARAIRPVHAMLDGDTVFSVSTGDASATGTSDANLTDMVGHAASDALVRAALDAATATESLGGWPSVEEASQAVRAAYQHPLP
jgi:L-aminopeptidase/D-esterase-like protein